MACPKFISSYHTIQNNRNGLFSQNYCKRKKFYFSEEPPQVACPGLWAVIVISANVQASPDDLGTQVGVPVGLSPPGPPPGTCGAFGPTQAKFPLQI